MFTFVMDFRGGTYVSQPASDILSSAVIEWGEMLNAHSIKYLGLAGKNEVLALLKTIELNPLDGLNCVWFFSLSIRQGFITVNVIETKGN